MEKDIGKIKKNDGTDIVVRIDDFGGKVGLTIREFVNESPSGYKGFTKAGTRIPSDKFLDFRELINSINLGDLKPVASESAHHAGEAKHASKEEKAIEDY